MNISSLFKTKQIINKNLFYLQPYFSFLKKLLIIFLVVFYPGTFYDFYWFLSFFFPKVYLFFKKNFFINYKIYIKKFNLFFKDDKSS